MKQFQISDTPHITEENFANLFNIYLKNDNELTYSINKSIHFKNINNLSPNKFTFYECQNRDQWSTISYKFYNTIELWWLICKFNNIQDPVLESPVPGQTIKLLNPGLVNGVIMSIKGS